MLSNLLPTMVDLPGSAPGFLAYQASVLLLNYRSIKKWETIWDLNPGHPT